MRKLALLVLLLALLAQGVHAMEPDVIVYPRPASGGDTRFDYHLSLLREALNRTVPEYGPFELHPSSLVMNQLRQFDLLERGTPGLDVSIKPTSVKWEQLLTPVRIPLGKGLLGWRILLIRKSKQGAFAQVENIDDLKAYKAGQGFSWSDVEILRHNGLTVVEGTMYEGLFRMLLSDRFQFFPRGVGEALVEWDERHEELPQLHVEETLLLHYPFARYFWTGNSERGRLLNERIYKGLDSMIRDGSFDTMFQNHYGESIRRAGLSDRKLIRLVNPNIPVSTPIDRKELWFNPFAE
ncbi:hypothetical protein [Pseudodesulfovibrio sp. zrk46]|uniref:hypothetical protein n=1 Tax=Pseudodesulfovibrio sp. zrk46 TaxID=2725288 RepID=UPI0014496D80|nr:hypothetical protein [Pseudodesulfovibrio sp. zrk46]QJB56902.1 hypothetical protein HFN16_11025 [Pseudodesulfovibrio sp. zrk46]